jgi:ubiquinone/menaquinone biosynthesis C-methylase UbiE
MTTNPPSKEDDRIKLFDSWADSYAEGYSSGSPNSHYFSTRLAQVNALVDVPAGGKILDIGCGAGMMAELLCGRGLSFFGVDLSRKMLRACQNRVGHLDTCHLAVGRIEQLPYGDDCFDACICTGVLEYVDDATTALREIVRVMKPNGIVVFSLWNQLSPYRMTQSLRYFLSGQNSRERMFTEWQGRDLVHLAGLTLTDLLYFDFNIFVPPLDSRFPRCSVSTSRHLEFLRRSILRWIGTAILIKAQKSLPSGLL